MPSAPGGVTPSRSAHASASCGPSSSCAAGARPRARARARARRACDGHAAVQAARAGTGSRSARAVDLGVPGRRPKGSRPVAAPGRAPSPSIAGRAPMPTGRRRRASRELGFIGWFRERLGDTPVRADRSRPPASAAAGSTGSTCGSSSSSSSRRLGLRMFRLAEPTRCTSTRSTTPGRPRSSSRTGGTASPRHLRVDPPASRQIHHGRGHRPLGRGRVSATSQLGVAGPRCGDRTAPRRPAPPASRAGERVHVATGEEIRGYDLRTRELVAPSPVAGRERAGRRLDRPSGWSSASTTAGSRPSTSPRSRRGRRTPPAARSRPTRSTPLLVTADGGRRSGRLRCGSSARSTRHR